MVICAYSEDAFDSCEQYGCHLKILHNKKLYSFGTSIICGQDGCPLDFHSFQSFKVHYLKKHKL